MTILQRSHILSSSGSVFGSSTVEFHAPIPKSTVQTGWGVTAPMSGVLIHHPIEL